MGAVMRSDIIISFQACIDGLFQTATTDMPVADKNKTRNTRQALSIVLPQFMLHCSEGARFSLQ